MGLNYLGGEEHAPVLRLEAVVGLRGLGFKEAEGFAAEGLCRRPWYRFLPGQRKL
jgi:hypothetical protein